MSQSMQDDLFARLGPGGIQEIAGMIGTDTESAKSAVQASVCTIVGGMAHQAEHARGAQSLRSALDQHTDSDPFTNVTDMAGTDDGEKILTHLFGDRGTEQAAQGISQFMGINPRAVSRVMAAVAPMVMTVLAGRFAGGRGERGGGGMDTAAMAQDLDQERNNIGGGLRDLLRSTMGKIFGDTSGDRTREPGRSESGAIPMPGGRPIPKPPPRRPSSPDR
ncbi:calcium-binding protein [Acrocarpospora phusangensis]|uniref:Calcium-binding protein n=1 Tax=Acrocarpospora phusangensis TaxID=1070424 RepID=A0A919QI29_9ACTN|nr:DUF937 domain-containing protein [Acrocarpospora phusangensis]GIH28404.1 calcium-binding protein [Acrocarpospora phusangensis]